LALTNHGRAGSEDVIALARTIRDGVAAVFGITLVPEPVLLGCRL
jgi:UDP-N-acetylmuramate dehydrogenase